ncbi:hypothetical protein [Asinibacterium sp. OR53]|uniref:hypothetical protein n=1 Tax=Asinibacterium sp. OR53 TaxID=925409 RepID=UPI000478705E|nr:hypothetical protein [Asinibacterium sp. OR53]
MEKKIIISTASDIEQIAHEIGLFKMEKRIIKVHMNQFSETENRQLEQEIVKRYATGGQQLDNKIGLFTLAAYVVLMVTGVIPVLKLGFINSVLLYILFTIVLLLGIRLYRLWHAKRSLRQLARGLQVAPAF